MEALLQKIQELYGTLPAAQKRVASYILENYREVSFYSVTSLAAQIGVSETSVIKFCIRLGFRGYGGFRRVLSEHLQSTMTMYGNFEERSKEMEQEDLMDRVEKTDVQNIRTTLENPANRANLSLLAERIDKAENVYVIGFRSSALMAQYLSLALIQQDRPVQAIIPGIGEYAETVCRMTPKDLLIAISFSRYSSEVVKTVDLLKGKKVPCVLITDTPACPMFGKADLTFLCGTQSCHYTTSHVGCLSLMNAIVTATSLKRKGITKDYMKQLEEMFKQFDTFAT